jgi:hypothetical protein
MPDKPDVPAEDDPVMPSGPVVTPNPGLAALIAEAQETWVARVRDPQAATPGWRAFEDAFPTFYQFTNRPR